MSLRRLRRIASKVRVAVRDRATGAVERIRDRLPPFAIDDRSGSDGVIWEPLVLTSFMVAAAVTGATAPVESVFGPRPAAEDTAVEAATPVPDIAVLAAPEGPAVAVPAPEPLELVEGPAGDANAASPLARQPLAEDASIDRALISWWDEGRWESRDARADQWRRDWLRIARRNPERVPLELWISILEWEPADERLVRSAARAADRYSSRQRGRRSGWRTSSTDSEDRTRADVVREIEQAVRDARRRAEYEDHKDDGPDSSWYRSLLRRLRGG